MRRCLLLVLLGLAVVVPVAGQETTRVLTRPSLPNPQVLARMGMKQRWYAYLPIAGIRDSLTFVQAVDGQIVAQTKSGTVICLDGNSGAVQWQIRLGEPYASLQQPVAANDRLFLIVTGLRIYAVDRKSGIVEYEHATHGIMSAPPALDDGHAYLCFSDGKVNAFAIPQPTSGDAAANLDANGKPLASRRIVQLWTFQSETKVVQPPLVLANDVVFVSEDGTLSAFHKDRSIRTDRFYTGVGVVAPLSHKDGMIYMASQDFSVYALELEAGVFKLRWRHVASSPIVQRPWVVGDDWFVVGKDKGIVCLDRATGQVKWEQSAGTQYVAASKRMVFAGDERGRLLCLDRQKGQVINVWDASLFAMRVPNGWSDRIYVANHDGLLLCLQDADKGVDQPLIHNPKPTKKDDKKPTAAPPPKEETEEKP